MLEYQNGVCFNKQKLKYY